jgi:hypothetical protein
MLETNMTIYETVQVYVAASELLDTIDALDRFTDDVEALAQRTLGTLDSLTTRLLDAPLRTRADRDVLAQLVAGEIATCARDGVAPDAVLAQMAARLAG